MTDKSKVTLDVPTVVTVTITNTSGTDGGAEGIGCVKISVPSDFAVGSASVSSVSSGFSWSASSSSSGSALITAWASSDSHRLRGDPRFEQLVLSVAVTGLVLGSHPWTADEYRHSDCSNSHDRTAFLPMSVDDGANDPPTASDDSASGAHDRDLVVAAPGVLANDTDPDGDTLSASVVTGPSNGSVALAANGGYTYAPNAGFIGTDTFTYEASDGTLTSAPATVTLTITNAAPVATDDAWTVAKNVTLVVDPPGVLANDADGDSDALSAGVLAGPSNGSLSLAGDGSFTYTPDPDYIGPDAFTYAISDGITTATASVDLTVANSTPVAVADGYAASKNVALTVPAAAGVLANDSDTDGDTLAAALVAGPVSGSVTVDPDGAFVYTPAPGATGTDTFDYEVTDGTATATGTVTIAVSNDAPSGAPDGASVIHDRTLTVAAPGVLANDADANGDTLSAAEVTSPANGTLTLAADGGWTYAPDPGFAGTDTFEYAVTDGAATTGPILVAIDVTNVAPTAADDAASTTRNGSISKPAPGVLANDTDADGDTLVASLLSGTVSGTLALQSYGAWTYTPDPGFVGTDAFTYSVSDGAATATATVTITVTNGAPTAADDAAAVVHDRILTVPAPGALANDTDPDGDGLTATLDTAAANGVAVVAPDGSYVYTPNAGFVGTDAFRYRVSDGLATTIATVTVSVTNAIPTVVDDAWSTTEGVALVVPARGVLANDTDGNGDALTALVSTLPTQGTLTLTADGSFVYVPSAGFSGTDAFTYRASDGVSTSARATVVITVVAIPRPLPVPTPTPTPEPEPTPEPTPTPTPEPTPEPSVDGSPAPTAEPSPTPRPVTPAPQGDTFVIPSGSGSGGGGDDGGEQVIDIELAAASLGSLGAFMWLVPGMALSVPGLLVVVAIGAQAAGGLAWLPLVWRKIGKLGAPWRRRRHVSGD